MAMELRALVNVALDKICCFSGNNYDEKWLLSTQFGPGTILSAFLEFTN